MDKNKRRYVCSSGVQVMWEGKGNILKLFFWNGQENHRHWAWTEESKFGDNVKNVRPKEEKYVFF